MWSRSHKIGSVSGIKYEIISDDVIKVYLPNDVEDLEMFRVRSKHIVKYLVDESIFTNQSCQIKIIKTQSF